MSLTHINYSYYGEDGFERNVGKRFAKLDLSVGNTDTKILCTEDLRNSLQSVECKDKSVNLIFSDEIEFSKIEKEWDFMNQSNKSVLLITESDHCDRNHSDATTRQPWKISRAIFDGSSHHVELSAEPQDWEIFGNNWHLIVTRDDFNDSAQMPKGAAHALTKRARVAGIDLNHDFDGLGFELPPPDPTDMLHPLKKDKSFGSIEASGSLSGSLDLDVDLRGSGLGTIHVVARDVEATLNVQLDIYEANRAQPPTEHEIMGYVPLGAGIYIKGILDIGPTVKGTLSTGYKNPPEKPSALAVGYNMTLPNPSEFTWNILNPQEPKLVGFTPDFEALPPRISEDISMDFQIGPKLGVTFDAKVLGRGLSVGFNFAASSMSVKAIGTEEDQACSKGVKQGVKLDVDLIQQVEAFQKADIVVAKTAATQTLASTSYDLFTACLPVDKGMTIATTAPVASTTTYAPDPGSLKDAMKGLFREAGGKLSAVFVDDLASPVTSAAAAVKSEAEEAEAKVTEVADFLGDLFGKR